jgi:hypothetical protein
MRRQQNPDDRLDALGRIDFLDHDRVQLDARRQAVEFKTHARPRELDLPPTHAGARAARRAAVFGGNENILPGDVRRRRHRRHQPGAVAHMAVVRRADDEMDMG